MTAQISPNVWQWARDIIDALGGVPTVANMRLLAAWIGGEHGWDWNGLSNASHNPLDTGWRMPGSRGLSGNPDGVQVYPNHAVGLQATINTLNQQSPSYGTIVAALKNSDMNLLWSPQGQQELDTWGGGMANGMPYWQWLRDDLMPEVPTPPTQYLTSSHLAGGVASVTEGPLVQEFLSDINKGASDLASLVGLNKFIKPGESTKGLIVGAIVLATILALIAEGTEEA